MDDVRHEMSDGEKREFRTVFREWRGTRVTKPQKRLLRKYNISYEIGARNHVKFNQGGRFVYTSLTPGDWRTGRNLSNKLIALVEGT